MNQFKLVSKFKPTGDQPQAIKKIVENIEANKKNQTLLGVTGSGKTFTLACAIEKLNRPTLVISHNKTLAAQLYAEFREFFPHNAVEYFVSYYDYYQPESYLPQTDTYIEKDASINERLDRLRLSATSSLMSRNDVIIVSSVSCIYNLGSPADYQNLISFFEVDQVLSLEKLIKNLLDSQYVRNDFDFKRATFRVKGDVVDVFCAYKETAFRIQFFDEKIEKIYEFDPLTGEKINDLEKIGIYPAKHFVIEKDKIEAAFLAIETELAARLKVFEKQGKILEAKRLEAKTKFDLEMLKEAGYCHGIENYSRNLSGRDPGSRPYCLIDYFGDNFLTVIDESHVTLPQVRGMFNGDKARKETLVKHGFRLPSCLDNRPLRFEEFESLIGQSIFVSATPSKLEIDKSQRRIVEQVIRPTGLVDPLIEVRPTKNQIDDIVSEIKVRALKNERVIVTTLTKRMTEELYRFLLTQDIKANYLHSELDVIERARVIYDLRRKEFDCIVGINLLREGIDLPEVSLVVILDADKEGFLRSTTSLIQIAGRCARNVNGKVIMYADKMTNSMERAIFESERRRKIQLKHNKDNKITPRSIEKHIKEGIEIYSREERRIKNRLGFDDNELEILEAIKFIEKEMILAAKNLQFERAADRRDKLAELQNALKALRKKT